MAGEPEAGQARGAEGGAGSGQVPGAGVPARAVRQDHARGRGGFFPRRGDDHVDSAAVQVQVPVLVPVLGLVVARHPCGPARRVPCLHHAGQRAPLRRLRGRPAPAERR